MRNPSLWLYLLGAVTFLVIALRRVLRRQIPLNDQLYSKQVAIDHVHSGVAWVRFDGLIGSVNPALAKTLGVSQRNLVGSPWLSLFPEDERPRLDEAYREALLMGKTSLKARATRQDDSVAQVDVLLVTIHSHKSQLIGHYCLMEDLTRVLELEEQVEGLTAGLAAAGR